MRELWGRPTVISTSQVHPAAPPVAPVLQAEPTAPGPQADPLIRHLQNPLQNHLKFWVWSEVYEQSGVLLFFEKGKTRLLTATFKGTAWTW